MKKLKYLANNNIPRNKNEVIARLLDAGKKFFATIQAKEWEGNWLRIEIKVFLKDWGGEKIGPKKFNFNLRIVCEQPDSFCN